MNNKIIENIFHGDNDEKTKWVPRTNWTYYRDFTGNYNCNIVVNLFNTFSILFSVNSNFLKNTNINLVFEGLDTFAEIYINEVKVGESKNMFVQYIFSIKKYLKVRESGFFTITLKLLV